MNNFDFLADGWRKHLAEITDSLSKVRLTADLSRFIVPPVCLDAMTGIDSRSVVRDAIQRISEVNTLGSTEAIQDGSGANARRTANDE